MQFLTKGYHKVAGDFWQNAELINTQTEGRNTTHYISKATLPGTFMNEYLLDEGDNFAGKVTGWDDSEVSVLDLGRDRLLAKNAWGIHPKNIYQGMAIP